MSDEDRLSDDYRVMLQWAEHLSEGEWAPLPEEFYETGVLPSSTRLTELLFDNWRWFQRITTVGSGKRNVETTELSVQEACDWAILYFDEDETPAELIFADEFRPPRKVLLCDEQKPRLFDPRTGWRLIGAWFGPNYPDTFESIECEYLFEGGGKYLHLFDIDSPKRRAATKAEMLPPDDAALWLADKGLAVPAELRPYVARMVLVPDELDSTSKSKFDGLREFLLLESVLQDSNGPLTSAASDPSEPESEDAGDGTTEGPLADIEADAASSGPGKSSGGDAAGEELRRPGRPAEIDGDAAMAVREAYNAAVAENGGAHLRGESRLKFCDEHRVEPEELKQLLNATKPSRSRMSSRRKTVK